MPIACTRCGASEDGEIITGPIAFAFKHDPGCGHGIGPLCVIKGSVSKKSKKKKESKKLNEGEVPWESNDSTSNADITLTGTTETSSTLAESEGT